MAGSTVGDILVYGKGWLPDAGFLRCDERRGCAVAPLNGAVEYRSREGTGMHDVTRRG